MRRCMSECGVWGRGERGYLPADEMFGGLTEDAIFGELERELPVDDFAVAGQAVRVESVGEVI